MQIETQGNSSRGDDIYFYSRGIRLHGRYFQSAVPRKGNFLLLHGLTSNSGWFEKIATKLSASGYNVLTYDRRGSGRSEGTRGDIPCKDAFYWDMQAAVDFMRAKAPVQTHVVAFSYSWKLPPLFIQKVGGAAQKITSMVMVAPASDLSSAVQPSLKDKLKILFNINGPYFSSPVKDTDLTQNKETLDWIRNSKDSRPQAKFTRRFLLTSNEMDDEARKIVSQIKKPMLVFVPKDDHVINHEKVKQRFSRGPLGYARKIHEIDGSHIVDTDGAQDQLVERLMGWVSSPNFAAS